MSDWSRCLHKPWARTGFLMVTVCAATMPWTSVGLRRASVSIQLMPATLLEKQNGTLFSGLHQGQQISN